jgi:FlaG protein
MDVLAIDPAAGTPAAQTAQAAVPSGPVGALPQAPDPNFKTLPKVADETLHRALSQLVGGGSNVSVQFRVSHDPEQVVTVFRNADTGEVITQFPSEALVLIAQFFNKLAGAVLDRTA